MNRSIRRSGLFYAMGCFAWLFVLAACTGEPFPGDGMPLADGVVQIVPRVKRFQEKAVVSRTAKTEEELKITSLHLFVFDSDGKKVGDQYVEGIRPTFVIDTRTDPVYTRYEQSKLENAVIYILANTKREWLSGVTTEAELNAVELPVDQLYLTPPANGFPMLGVSAKINLRSDRTEASGTQVEEVTLINFFAKIVAKINVRTEQQLDDYIPQFQLTRWQVHRVPNRVRVGMPAEGAESMAAVGEDLLPVVSGTRVEGSNPVSEQGEMMFTFYMPEHRVNPNRLADTAFLYPNHLDANKRQYYKPLLCDTATENPTYLTLEGIYSDHQGHARKVRYSVFLGENNYNNFHVNRNYQYNNYITLRGITNHAEGGKSETGEDNISVDHRVWMERGEFDFIVERETLLDAHFEIRPLDIELNLERYPESWVQVEIQSPDRANWVRLEQRGSAGGNAAYCSNGMRKYFTTDLVTATLADNTSAAVTSEANKRIWLYFDENLEAHAEGYREAVIAAHFYERTGQTSPSKTMLYRFRQRDLHAITHEGRDYLIEYYEEYLYDFDAKEAHGNTSDGMAWGLENKQISDQVQSIRVQGGFFNFISDIINKYVIPQYSPFYDFYLTRDPVSADIQRFDYSGYQFCKKIIRKAGIGVLDLNSDPRSAVEYCYNKNKRDAAGKVDTTKMEWYLPAIDEMEDIAMGGYSTFEVFQNRYYWSSQPAYERDSAYYKGNWTMDRYGSYMVDDTLRARATRVRYLGNDDYETIDSGIKSGYKWMLNMSTNGVTRTPLNTMVLDEGNMSRGTKNRIRCVRRSREARNEVSGN